MKEQNSRNDAIVELNNTLRQVIANAILFNNRVAENVGINPNDLQCLNIIEILGTVTPGVLAGMTGLTTGGITGVVDRLEQAGYVRREHDTQDRRSVRISLITENMTEIYQMFKVKSDKMQSLLASYDDERINIICGFLKDIANTH